MKPKMYEVDHRALGFYNLYLPRCDMSDKEILKPCPFCGNEKLIITYGGALDVKWSHIFCQQCMTQGPKVYNEDIDKNVDSECIKLWNIRII